MKDPQRRLAERSDELLTEANHLDALEHVLQELPEGSTERVDAAADAEGHAARLRDVAREEDVLTREIVERHRDASARSDEIGNGEPQERHQDG
jgi:hypothetical protein